jgi:hypothetical protein
VTGTAGGREYPVFGPEDDDFHDEVLTDRWWETETVWFSWNVPERRLGGWLYCQARPNARLCNGGAWVWDDTAPYSWELPYHANYSGLQLPDRVDRDLRDFAWPNGVHVKVLEPLMRYQVDYEDPGAFEINLEFDAIMAPNPHPVGVAPFLTGTHLDQAGHVTGEMVLHGERVEIDCYTVRDRSWGPRPAGRPRKRKLADADVHSGTGGIGYSFGVASPRDAWLVYSVPRADDDMVVCGFLLRDGEYAHVLAGERRVEVDPKTGWVVHLEITATDDAGRELAVTGDAVSRHWKGHGGDSLMHWRWDAVDAYGEDQTYLSRATWEALRARALQPD